LALPQARRAELRQIRFHDLRHTCATLLLSKNVNPNVVSEMLGQASVRITLDTYSHLTPNVRETAAQTLEDALRLRVAARSPWRLDRGPLLFHRLQEK
jgi:integrase